MLRHLPSEPEVQVDYRELDVAGAWEVTPRQHGDPRGLFLEWFGQAPFADRAGHALALAQANLSVSAAGVVRGIHFADVPPGQAKYVTCTRGAGLDVIVDIRVGSPTFGQWQGVRLDDETRKAVYLAEGLGHGFCALTDDATLTYLCSATYSPGHEHGVHPLDAELGIRWPADMPRLSERDAKSPSLAEARDSGLLPEYEACVAYTKSLRHTEK